MSGLAVSNQLSPRLTLFGYACVPQERTQRCTVRIVSGIEVDDGVIAAALALQTKLRPIRMQGVGMLRSDDATWGFRVVNNSL